MLGFKVTTALGFGADRYYCPIAYLGDLMRLMTDGDFDEPAEYCNTDCYGCRFHAFLGGTEVFLIIDGRINRYDLPL